MVNGSCLLRHAGGADASLVKQQTNTAANTTRSMASCKRFDAVALHRSSALGRWG